MNPFSLNIRGQLHQYTSPTVMGIINITPDSFFSGSRAQATDEIMRRTEAMVAEGADFIDIGAYSSRPGCSDVDIDEELRRLDIGMAAIRKVTTSMPVSVDTFRSEVARKAIKEMGADIINDISGGLMDHEMFPTVADLHAPYILMHMRGTPATMLQYTQYDDIMDDVMRDLAKRIAELYLLGVNDLIIDPGFGFSKTLDQNYLILKHLELLQLFQLPVLVGMSRKSMVTKLLNITPAEALEGTVALNTMALQRGAAILRVHDVAPAVQAVNIYNQINAI